MVYGFDRINRIRIELVRVFVSFFIFWIMAKWCTIAWGILHLATCLLLLLSSLVLLSLAHIHPISNSCMWFHFSLFFLLRTDHRDHWIYVHFVVLFFSGGSYYCLVSRMTRTIIAYSPIVSDYCYLWIEIFYLAYLCIRFINFLDKQVHETTNKKKVNEWDSPFTNHLLRKKKCILIESVCIVFWLIIKTYSPTSTN